MSNYDRFVETHKIKIEILSRPEGKGKEVLAELRRKDPDGSPHMDRWRIRLEAPNGKGIETDYSKGIGLRIKRERIGGTIRFAYRGDKRYLPLHLLWKGGLTLSDVEELGTYFPEDPTAAEILSSLACDVRDIENGSSFETWANDLGYDPDSRKAEGIYRQCEKAYRELGSMLGRENLAELLTIDPD